MAKRLSTWIGLVLCLVLYQVSPVFGQEVEYDIVKQAIEAQISSDGSVHFYDEQSVEVTYFNGFIFKLDREGYNVRDYRVGIIDPRTSTPVYFEENATGAPETYQVTQTDQFYEFKVYYPTQDSLVRFIFEYTIEGLVTNFNDTAEFNRKVVGTATDESLDVQATILLPGRVQETDNFRAWAHGAPQGQVSLTEIEGKSAVRLEVDNNPANQFVEANIIFPTALTPNNQNRVEVNKKQEIIEREAEQVARDKADYDRRLGRIRFFALLGTLALPVYPLYVFLYYRRNKKALNPHPVQLPDHIYELPEALSPALMATTVYRTTPTTEDLTATILDLVRLGYLDMTEVAKEKRGLFSRGETTTLQFKKGPRYQDQAGLKSHETYALAFVMPEGKDQVNLQELEEWTAKSTKFAKRQNKLWTRFSDNAQVMGERLRGSTREKTSAQALSYLGVVGAFVLTVFLVLFVAATPYSNFIIHILIIGGLAFLANLALVLMTSIRPIMTADQDRRRQSWDGFKKMLSDVGNMQMREIGSLDLWETFLVYAVSLGVADKVVDAMKLQLGSAEVDQMRVGGTFYHHPYLFSRVLHTSVQNTVQSSQPKPTSTGYRGNNAGGFGGGFSGGSSGGSGGGSGSGGF